MDGNSWIGMVTVGLRMVTVEPNTTKVKSLRSCAERMHEAKKYEIREGRSPGYDNWETDVSKPD